MLNTYAVDDFTIKRWQSYDKYNNPTFLDQPVKGYIEWKNQRVQNIAGEEVVSQATIWLPEKYARPIHKDVITINGIDHSIINVTDLKDFSGTGWTIYIN